MKRTLLLLVFISLGGLPKAPAAMAAGASKAKAAYTVSVAPFVDSSGFVWKWDVASTWQTILAAALDDADRVVVLAADLAGATAPSQLHVQGTVTHVDTERSAGSGGVSLEKLGLRLGGRDHARVNVTLSIVDSLTGHVYASEEIEGEAKRRSVSIGYSEYTRSGDLDAIRKEGLGRAMENAAVAAAEWLAGKLDSIPWKGAVIAVDTGMVQVNRGTREGLRPGAVLVAGQEQALRDPTTGEVLKTVFDEYARLRVVAVEEKLSTCQALSGDVSMLDAGTEVRLP